MSQFPEWFCFFGLQVSQWLIPEPMDVNNKGLINLQNK